MMKYVASHTALTTHSTGARVSLPFIINLSVAALCARPVNSGGVCLLVFKVKNVFLEREIFGE